MTKLTNFDKECMQIEATRMYNYCNDVYDTFSLQLSSLKLFADALGFKWNREVYSSITKGFYSKDYGFVSFRHMCRLHNGVVYKVHSNGDVLPILDFLNIKFTREAWENANHSKLVDKVKLQALRNKKKLNKANGNPFIVQNYMVEFVHNIKDERSLKESM